MSRSTWACELKCKCSRILFARFVTLHVSVWVEMFVRFCPCVCHNSHAPRERVSWNVSSLIAQNISIQVTLHVSVWVEICVILKIWLIKFVTLHVSVWVEINMYRFGLLCCMVTLHVSVWVEIMPMPFCGHFVSSHAPRERVSWNIYRQSGKHSLKCHAPRERVSWNPYSPLGRPSKGRHAPRERVSWNSFITKRFGSVFPSRSTWACELKCNFWYYISYYTRHAPRERVSWNLRFSPPTFDVVQVTLHVSVWVEISSNSFSHCLPSHAPRERVSWNFCQKSIYK